MISEIRIRPSTNDQFLCDNDCHIAYRYDAPLNRPPFKSPPAKSPTPLNLTDDVDLPLSEDHLVVLGGRDLAAVDASAQPVGGGHSHVGQVAERLLRAEQEKKSQKSGYLMASL